MSRSAAWQAAKFALPFVIGLIICALPTPDGVHPGGMAVLAVFVGTVVGLIFQPLPPAAVALIGLTVAMITKTVDSKVALSGFGDSTIWMIVSAFFISRGFITTGLGQRVALTFVRAVGRSSLGLAYGLSLTSLVLAPATPSSTARTGAIVYPIAQALSESCDSHPDDKSRRRLGAYLGMVTLCNGGVVAAMFLTAMASNPVAKALAAKAGVSITWGNWFLAALVPGVIAMLVIPWLTYKIYPPELKHTPEAPRQAAERLKEMGAMGRGEWIMSGTFVLLIFMWSFGAHVWNLSDTSAAFLGIAVLLLTRTLSWSDLASDKGAWATLIWFAVLVMMAGQLTKAGVIDWFSQQISGQVSGMSWLPAALIVLVVYFFSHYFFASSTAQLTAMYGAFLAATMAVGAPALPMALLLGFLSNIWGGLTHYGSGQGAVIHGSGYITTEEWWKKGFILSTVCLVIFVGVGLPWMKVIGLW